MADGQVRYLEGVIEFYKARTDTKMTIAAERLALIAVLTLPITALSSVYGMNIIVNDRTDFPHLAVVLAAMLVVSASCCAGPSDRDGGSSSPAGSGQSTDLLSGALQLAARAKRASQEPSSKTSAVDTLSQGVSPLRRAPATAPQM